MQQLFYVGAIGKSPTYTLSRGEGGPKGRERNGGRTDLGAGLTVAADLQIAALK